MSLTIFLLVFVSLGYADDLSSLQCTANDVRITGPGVITNEPCECSGTFNAIVAFTVENNAAADRYCLTLHLCRHDLAGIPAGMELTLTRVATGKTTTTYSTTIRNYPCGMGLVCLGAVGPGAGGIFPQGARCPAGQCCSTIAYNVKQSDPCPDTTPQIPSKCRHQRICIRGRGGATLTCPNGCNQPCGGKVILDLCATGDIGPFSHSLPGFDKITGAATKCQRFSGSVATTRTVTGIVTDGTGCQKTASRTITVQPAVQITGITQPTQQCNGALTFTLLGGPNPSTTAMYTWKVDGVPRQPSSSRSLIIPAPLQTSNLGKCHVVEVTGVDGACRLGSAFMRYHQCIKTSFGSSTCPNPP